MTIQQDYMGSRSSDVAEFRLDREWTSFDSAAAVGGFLLGGAVGAGLGAVIGAGFKSDRWEAVPLDRVGMSLMPRLDGGLALGMQLKF